jgi:predicted alpha/beta superfamily hydrolase
MAGEPSRRTLRNVWSPQLRNRRQVDVYLPASYARSGRRYPVVYVQDGQNLSDPATAFAGKTWQLDDILADLAARDIEIIAVGVHHAGAGRIEEYSPFPDRRHGGGLGDAYLGFLADTLKPRIDRQFRTHRTASHTAIAGSSMGGLISLYAWFARPDLFSRAAALSPSLWYGRDRLFDFIESRPLPSGRLYLDVGTAEGAGTLRDARAFASVMEERRAGEDRFAYSEDRGGRHEESAWSGRLGGAIAFLFDRR